MTRKNFAQGLDRLANFFVSPIMSKDSIDRELKAIDSGMSFVEVKHHKAFTNRRFDCRI